MNPLKMFLRYSQFSTGDFEKIFADFHVPPCPQVVLALMEKLKDPDIEIEQIVSVLESDASLAGQILKTANSALYALPVEVTSIGKAVSILGLKEIENIAIGYAMTRTIHDPGWEEFNMAEYWYGSLLRALFAKHSAEIMDIHAEEAFSAGLLQDIAMPVLLSQWFDLYSEVYLDWKKDGGDIHLLEEEALSWNHCQAGAWIAQNWGLPDIFICCIGLHASSQAVLTKLGLQRTAAAPVALSSLLPQAAASREAAVHLINESKEAGIGMEELVEVVEKSEGLVDELAGTLGLTTTKGPSVTSSLADAGQDGPT